MIEHGFEGINGQNPIKDKLPQLIEYYVKFYGEKYREVITDRLNHTIFVFAENQSYKYGEKIEKRFNDLIEKDIALGGENKEYLEKEKEKVLKLFYSARPRRYRKELENNCINYVTYYLKEVFRLENVRSPEIKQLAKDYIPLLKVGRNSYFKVYENNNEKHQFNDLITNIAKLKGFNSAEEYSPEMTEGIKYLSSIKKTNALKSQLQIYIDDYKNKMSEVVRDTVREIVRAGIAYSSEVIEEIEDYINFGDGLIALTTVSINLENPKYPICICCNNEPLMLDDRSFIHEVNHAVTCHASYKDDFFHTKCGITEDTYYVFNLDCIKKVSDDDRLTSFDEIINDYLSLKIYKIAEEDGFSIGGHEEIESLYSAAFPLFGRFLERNLEDIKDIVLNEDGKAMERYLGAKNLTKLSNFATEMLNYCNKNICNKDYRKMLGFIGGEREVDFFKLAKRKNELIFSPYKKYLSFYSRGEKLFKEVEDYLDKHKNVNKVNELKVEEEKVFLEENKAEE